MTDFDKLVDHGGNNLPDVRQEDLQLKKKHLDVLREQIISYTSAIQHDYGYESVKIRYKSGWEAELSRREWFVEYEKEQFTRIGNNLLKKWIKDIGLPYHSHTLEEFLSYKESVNLNKIKNYVQKYTLEHQKGNFLEWYISTMFFRHFKHKKINDSNNLVFGVDEPLILEIDGEDKYIWFQKLIKGRSGLNCQPDFTISSTKRAPLDHNNVLGIIECKYVKGVTSQQVRQLFAVGLDLIAKFAILISFHNVNNSIKSGAANLGIKIQEIEDVVKKPNHIKDELNKFMEEEGFISSINLAILMKSMK